MRFRFRSIDALAAGAVAAFRRFPLLIVVSFAVGALSWYLLGRHDNIDRYMRVVGTGLLALPLAVALTIFHERPDVARSTKLLFSLAVGAFLAVFYFTNRAAPNAIFTMKIAQFQIAAHLLVAFVGFVPRGTVAGFWTFNEHLFARVLETVVYAAVIYAGLAATLATAHSLLEVPADGTTYVRLWVCVVFGFATWFFAAGVPRDVRDLPEVIDYPRGLRIFVQFVLIPLVTLYLFILYLYLGKVVIEWKWPQGGVGYLVSGGAIAGIFSLLLLHPLQERTENRWIKLYARGFYLALFPLLMVMLLGTWKRVSEYGITERRYFLVVLGGWIFMMASYFTVSRARNIKAVPITLGAIAFLTGFGPWSAYHVSRASQVARFRDFLAEVKAKGAEGVAFAIRKEMSSTLEYLNDYHEGIARKQFFPKLGHLEKGNETSAMLESVGVAYVSRWQQKEEDQHLYLYSHADPQSHSLVGFSVMVHFNQSVYDESRPVEQTLEWNGRQYRMFIDGDRLKIGDALEFPLAYFIKLAKHYQSSKTEMSVAERVLAADKGKGRLLLTSFQASPKGKVWRIYSLDVLLFLSLP